MAPPSPTAFAASLMPLAAAAAFGASADARSWGAAVARPPAVLADGSRPATLPVAVRRFAGRPVLGARTIAVRALPRSCRAEPRGRRVRAWLSPDGLSIVYTDRSARPRACDAVLVGRRWERCTVGVARSRDPLRIQRAGGALGVCTRGGRWRAFMWIRSSPRSAWALVDRRRYWVAYRTRGVRLIRISGTERPARGDRFRTRVVFLDARSRVVERRRVLGYVAG